MNLSLLQDELKGLIRPKPKKFKDLTKPEILAWLEFIKTYKSPQEPLKLKHIENPRLMEQRGEVLKLDMSYRSNMRTLLEHELRLREKEEV
ncbi:hypothetical protein ACFOEK_10740 [Litoribrevibacter euphylliae]|uniref:DUF1153 domain-containing protein n=1 Tax=Litoribrevibacter euphylliae TaxID=1834034 RepID=A0ABV7HC69_9GAMM